MVIQNMLRHPRCWCGILSALFFLAAPALANATESVEAIYPANESASRMSLDEFKAIQLLLIEQQFTLLDSNQDGFLDANERSEGLLRIQRQLQTAPSGP